MPKVTRLGCGIASAAIVVRFVCITALWATPLVVTCWNCREIGRFIEQSNDWPKNLSLACKLAPKSAILKVQRAPRKKVDATVETLKLRALGSQRLATIVTKVWSRLAIAMNLVKWSSETEIACQWWRDRLSRILGFCEKSQLNLCLKGVWR
jgi:hypothetical protein